MQRSTTIGLFTGTLLGAIVAGTVYLSARWASGAWTTAPCPQGWLARAATSTGSERTLARCEATAEGFDRAKIELRWSHDGALSDRSLSTLTREAGLDLASAPAPQRESLDGVESHARVFEHAGPSMKTDVYFLSAGQRYGMLSIVYGPASSFVEDDRVAAWLETIEGAAPWGAPVSPQLVARCPEGFSTLPASGEAMVVRCMRNVGTSAFTVLQLTQSDGGFGSDADRARLAGDIAQRVASGAGGRARVLIEPTPFTRARNVDAIRARFETDERVTLNTRVAWMRGATSGNVLAVYAGPDADEGPAAARAMLANVRARTVSSATWWVTCALSVVSGAASGAAVGRRRGGG